MPMKIAVCLKQVPSRDWTPRVAASGAAVDDRDAAWELNEPDAYALEEALRLRERYGGDVVACAAGPARVVQVLREALARGADRGIHVETTAVADADGLVMAKALAEGLRDEDADLVLAGLQSDDLGLAQTGVILAGLLDRPHATIVMEIQIEADRVRVKRELEDGWFQWVGLPLPAILTIQSGINQLRYATLKGIMAARRKEIRTVTAAVATGRVRVAGLSVPARARETRLLGGTPAEAARQLVALLKEEARVLS